MEIIIGTLQLLLLCFLPNSYLLIARTGALFLIPLFVVLFLAANLMSLLPCRRFSSARLRVCDHGARCLKLFLVSVTVSALYHIVLMNLPLPERWTTILWSALVCILAESVLFWNGMLCVYLASVQLGVRHRAVGILCGCVPILHLFVLVRIIRTVSEEVAFETACAKRDDGGMRRKYAIPVIRSCSYTAFSFGIADSRIIGAESPRLFAKMELSFITEIINRHPR